MPSFVLARTTPRPTIVGLGEALFDCFDDRVVLGGAPVNVAIHANALLAPSGGAGVPAARVGDDELGRRFFTETSERGLDQNYIQTDALRPTGRVRVRVDPAGQAAYRFEDDSAWDALELTPSLVSLAQRCDAVAFGTLAQRSPASHAAITGFLKHATQAIKLFDVNLRQDLYSPGVIDSSLRLASAVKLNEEELTEVYAVLGLGAVPERGVDESAALLLETFQLDWLALTRGGEGTVLYAGGDKHSGEPAACDPQPGADSVGAGDACCAGLLCGALLGWSIDDTVDFANRLGAFVAGQPGATPRLPRELLRKVALTEPKNGAEL